MEYAELHMHSYYSVLDGYNSPYELVERAVELQHTAVGITDHGTLTGHRALQRACRELQIKPILGIEAYWTEDRKDRTSKAKRQDGTDVYNHILLHAKSQRGLESLQQLSEQAWTTGFYNKPRMDNELLRDATDLVVLSGCMSGPVSSALRKSDYDRADERTRSFKQMFGDDWYIEVQAHNDPELNAGLTQLAKKYDIRTVATTDAHFARPDDRLAEEILLLSGTNSKRAKGVTYESTADLPLMQKLDAMYPDRKMSFAEIDVFLHSAVDLRAAFDSQIQSGAVEESAIEQSAEIASKIGEYEYYADLELLGYDVEDAAAELRLRAYAGMHRLGLASDEYNERLEEELAVISQKSFDEYFLLLQDIVMWMRDQHIMLAPGRGSAAGSLLCYVLSITGVDPLQHGLLFYRFLNPERQDYPDVDIDIDDSRREELKIHLANTYSNVASISTFGFFKDAKSVKDVSRVLGVPYAESNAVTSKFETLDQYETSAETKSYRERYPLVGEYARKLYGRISNVGVHPGGIVLSRVPLNKYAPIETRTIEGRKERLEVLGMDGAEAESLGLVKYDFLGTKVLRIIDTTLRYIAQATGERPMLEEVTFDDPAVYAMLNNGYTAGVFQAEASSSTALIKQLQVQNFAELAASNALVRPGSMETIGASYIARKHGTEPVTYVHELMQDITADTYGCVLYQEQVMQTAMVLGGMSGAQADSMRKIIGKKRDAAEFAPYRDAFMHGAVRYVSTAEADQLWSDFEAHAKYSFNRSHAVSYSMITYWTAWLKLYYPLQFMTALVGAESEAEKRTGYFAEAQRLSVPVLLPSLEHSALHTSVQGDSLRLGLTDIKFVSDKVGVKIQRLLPYTSYDDFVHRARQKNSGVSTKAVAVLRDVGAMEQPADEAQLYELLQIPVFSDMQLPRPELLSDAIDYDESGAAVYRGIVTKIRTGKGWSQVQVVDPTGTFTAFSEQFTELVAGQEYVLLVGLNSICDFVLVSDLDNTGSPLAKWLATPKLPATVCVAVRPRTTKTGKTMATAVFSNAEHRLHAALVFPTAYPRLQHRIVPGRKCDPWLGKTNDGTSFVKDVE